MCLTKLKKLSFFMILNDNSSRVCVRVRTQITPEFEFLTHMTLKVIFFLFHIKLLDIQLLQMLTFLFKIKHFPNYTKFNTIMIQSKNPKCLHPLAN